MPRVLVTGAAGFVGSVLCGTLSTSGFTVRAAVRSAAQVPKGGVEGVIVGDISASPNWSAALRDVDHVVHLAARAHVMNDSPSNGELYDQVNLGGTQRLLAACVEAGVSRFVFQSSIKVNGEVTHGRGFCPDDEPRPQDVYGLSKLKAERCVLDMCNAGDTPMPFIVRSPLVYGPGVRANFLRLMRWVDREIPLPFGAIDNRRSLVSVWNLCDLIGTLLSSPPRAATVWMAADDHALSTPDLIRHLARGMGRRSRLIDVPPRLLQWGGRLLGRREELQRLCNSLEVDIGATRKLLGWQPPVSVVEGISRTVTAYLGSRHGAT